MAAKPSTATSVFERLLRAFDTGGFTYADFLEQLDQLLASGAPPTVLLDDLRRHESIEPLPDYAHSKVVSLLDEAVKRGTPPTVAPPSTAGGPGTAGEPPSGPARSTRPTERAKAPDPNAIARSAALAAELVAEKARADKLEQALAESAAARETERIAARVATHSRSEEVLRESARETERHRQEIQNLRDALAARGVELAVLQQERDAILPALEIRTQANERLQAELEALREAQRSAERQQSDSLSLRNSLTEQAADLDRTQRLLAERDAELAALRLEREKLVPALEARNQGASQLEADLHAARARGDALEAESRKMEATLAVAQRSLAERDTELAALRREHEKLVPALEARAHSTAQLEADLQAALARAVALNTELSAAQAALESEQRRAGELDEAWAEKIASSEAARRRSEETARDALRQAALDTERHDSELQQLRDTLSGHEAALAQARRALGERDAELASARAAVESEQRKRRELEQGFAERASASDAEREAARLAELEAVGAAAEKAVGDARQQAERLQTETRALRDTLSARDAAIAQVKQLLGERNTQLAALQKEQAKTATALEARTSNSAQMERDLAAARQRADGVTAELQASKDTIAALNARLKTDETTLTAAQSELAAVTKQSNAYLEQLRSREWRHGYDQNQFREADAHVVEPAIAPVVPAREPRIAPPRAKPYGVFVDKARSAASAAVKGSGGFLPDARARMLALGVAVVVVGVVAWLVLRHGPAPIPAPAPVVAAAPPPASPAPGTVITDCAECPGMTVLPAGRFKQGSAHLENGSSSEQPLHWVAVHAPFAMATNLVTVDEFQRFVTATGRNMQGCDIYDGKWKHGPKNSWSNPGFVQAGQYPVTCVSWTDAEAYAQWLSSKTGHKYRLPSASEWEYAARVGTESVRPWATDAGACANANVADASGAHRYPGWVVFPCNDGFVYTAPVGSFKTNAFGLNDMLGNVFQWTQDCWHADYTGAPIDGSARRDGDCSEHELRGGSWFSKPSYVRANYRNHFAADYRTSSVGIRLVRDI